MSITTILLVALAVDTILALFYIIRLSNRVRSLEVKNPPATEIHDSKLDEESVKEA